MRRRLRAGLRVAGRLYPRGWRERYGAEFEALVNEAEPVWSDWFDVLRGAAIMRVRTFSSHLKLMGVVVTAGLLGATVAGFATHGPYVSSSVVRVAAVPDDRAVDPQLPDRVNMAWQEVVSRASLSEIIQRPALDLYQSERRRKPFEDVIAGMKRDIRIERVEGSGGAATLRISFAYPDKLKAKGVVDVLTGKLLDNRDLAAQEGDDEVSIVSQASLPEVPVAPDRLGFLAWGLREGLLFGLLSAFLRWRAKWTLKIIGFGLAGCVAMSTLCFKYTGFLPEWYTSTATVRVTPQDSEGARHLLTDAEMADWLKTEEARVLSNANLREIIERPTIDLYSRERDRMGLDDVIATMRKNISIQLLKSRSAFTVSFTYPERFKAQRVVSALNAEFGGWGAQTTKRYRAMVAASKSTHWSKDGTPLACTIGDKYDFECIHNVLAWQASQRGASGARSNLNILEAPSLPEHRVPSAEDLMLLGLVLGMILGTRVLRNRQPVEAT